MGEGLEPESLDELLELFALEEVLIEVPLARRRRSVDRLDAAKGRDPRHRQDQDPAWSEHPEGLAQHRVRSLAEMLRHAEGHVSRHRLVVVGKPPHVAGIEAKVREGLARPDDRLLAEVHSPRTEPRLGQERNPVAQTRAGLENFSFPGEVAEQGTVNDGKVPVVLLDDQDRFGRVAAPLRVPDFSAPARVAHEANVPPVLFANDCLRGAHLPFIAPGRSARAARHDNVIFRVKTVLIFSWFYLPYVGGAELFVREIMTRLAGRYRFVVVTVRGDRALPRRETYGEVEILRVGLGAGIDKLLYPLPAVGKALRLDSVDLVHAIMVNASALASVLYRFVRPRPSILTIQNGDSEEYVRDWLGPAFPLYPRLHRPFDRVHVISRHLRDQALSYGTDPSRIRIIPNGVDLAVFSRSVHSEDDVGRLRAGLGLEGKRILLSASRLVLKNGIGDLVQAMPAIAAEHPDGVLLLIGDGEDRGQLERLSTHSGVEDRVRFLGSMDQRDVARHLCLADVFVRPSLSEGLGTAFLEALACEVPIVGTPVGGIPDFLEEGKTGLFCEPGNPESIARAVNRFLSEPELARRCAARGRAMVQKSYQWDAVAERIAGLYQELLQE